MPAAHHLVGTLFAAAILALAGCTGDDSGSASPVTSASPALAPATSRVVHPLTAAEAEALAGMNDRLKDVADQMYFTAMAREGDTVQSGVVRRGTANR